MRATTVRFGDDLWERLEREAGAIGVSVAQYIRDAALMRVVWEEIRRDGDVYAAAAAAVDGPAGSEDALAKSHRLRDESRALLAEAEQLQRRLRTAPEPPDAAA